jgi:hypothetical protein
MFILVPFATIIDSPCPRAWIGKENAELKETYKLIGGHSAVRAAAYPGQYIIGTQEYGRIYLKKGMPFGLRKRAFLKALDGICLRATLSLS